MWHHSLAVTGSGSLFAWCFNGAGSLGLNDTEKRLVPASPYEGVGVMGGEGGGGTLLVVVMAAAGETHSLAVTNSWRVFSWGHGALGALGWADLSSHFVPVEIDTLVAKHERVVLAAAGCAHSILVTEQGNVWTSGSFSSTCTPPPSAPSPAASLSPAPGLVGGGGQKKGF